MIIKYYEACREKLGHYMVRFCKLSCVYLYIYMCVCVSCSLVVSTCVHSYEGDPLDIYLVPSTTTCFSLALFFFRRNLYYIILGDGSFPLSFVIS